MGGCLRVFDSEYLALVHEVIEPLRTVASSEFMPSCKCEPASQQSSIASPQALALAASAYSPAVTILRFNHLLSFQWPSAWVNKIALI